MQKIYTNWGLLLSIIFLTISLFLPAYYCSSLQSTTEVNGGFCFIAGWFGILGFGSGLTWIANPLLFFAWIFHYEKPKLSLYLVISSFLIALSFLLFKNGLVSSAGSKEIVGYGTGYWMWILSHFIFLVFKITNLIKK